MALIIIILWTLIAFPILQEYAEDCEELNKKQRYLVCLIILLGAPAFGIVNFLSSVLDIVTGVDDNNDNDHFKKF